MKKLVLLFLMFFTMATLIQGYEECITNLQILLSIVKKKCKLIHLEKVRTDCPPTYNVNVYTQKNSKR